MPRKIIKSKGQFRAQLIGKNGEVVFWSENYKRLETAERSLEIVREISSETEPYIYEDLTRQDPALRAKTPNRLSRSRDK